MRGTHAIETGGPAAPTLAVKLQPATVAEGAGSARHWRFASDMRAALQLCVVATDVLAIAITGIAAYLTWERTLRLPARYWGLIVAGCVILVFVMPIAGMYRFAALRSHRDHLSRLTGLWVAVVLALITIIYLGRRADDYSRAWMLLWALGGWLGLVATRFLAWGAIRHFHSRLATRTVVVGPPIAAQRFARRLHHEGSGDVQVVGVFELEDCFGAQSPAARYDIDALARSKAADMRIDEIVLAVPCGDLLDLDGALDNLGARAADIKIGFDIGTTRRGGADGLVLVPVWRRPLAGFPAVLKRAVDVCVSAVLLISLLPLMAIIAALIKLDSPGPVLFRQQRFGLAKKPFELYKFRSMHFRAGCDPAVPQARRHDPRVTRVGRFLRRTSLDELPQLFNVLSGEMSLVGPRPHAILHDEKYAQQIEGYSARHHVKPGITGWAQVHGWRGETETLEKMRQRVEYDIYYINHWSLLLDFRILFKTLAAVFGQRNAY
jgi:putative colanic acid biosynthesis UDP-glucose lipid carrier transferase